MSEWIAKVLTDAVSQASDPDPAVSELAKRISAEVIQVACSDLFRSVVEGWQAPEYIMRSDKFLPAVELIRRSLRQHVDVMSSDPSYSKIAAASAVVGQRISFVVQLHNDISSAIMRT